jgi:PAS domain S-box-containing protein
LLDLLEAAPVSVMDHFWPEPLRRVRSGWFIDCNQGATLDGQMSAGTQKNSVDSSTDFLAGDGEMARLMRSKDWSHTTLGDPAAWPQALRTAVRLLLNSGHPMYIWWGPQGACLYNDAYRQSIGPERHPASLGRPAREVWEEIWHIIGWQVDQVMSGGKATWHENALVPITRDGRREDVYWTYSYSPIDDATAANGVGGVLVVCTETTQSVLATRRIDDERERLLQLLRQMPGFVGVLNGPNHVCEYVNDAYVAISGQRDFLGHTVREVFPEIAGQGFYELLDQVYATGTPFFARAVPLRLTGETADRFIDLRYEPIRDGGGSITGIFVGGYDVTETQRALAAARASEGKLRELNASLERQVVERTQARGRTWQLTSDLMGALNSRGFFETSNPAWMTVLGWTEEEVARRSIWELLHPDDVERTRGGFNLTQQGHPAIRFANRYRHKDGSYRWISWIGIPDDGMVYCTGRDITEEKAAEAELSKAQEALRQSQKMEAVGQLTGGLAHDFNNLLAGISGSLEVIDALLKRGRLTDVERYINAAQNSTRRAAALTQRLLAFSRRQTLDPKPTDVNRLVGGMEELIRRTVGPTVELEVVGAGGLWATKVDPSQLENALLNLCINARDAMAPDGGRLTIETANKWLDEHGAKDRDVPPGQYISLCVTDTGTGMAPDVIERAFDPFFTTKPLGEGTGLGLSMVYGFARQSGGQVRIYSELGKGTTMCVYLPRHLGATEVTDSLDDAQPVEEAHGETVLVVDDEATIRMLIKDVLTQNGYTPLEASDGPAALKLLRSNIHIDLLITDVGLPGGMNGRQVADAARVTRPDLKVLFITGYAENAVIGNGHLEPGMAVLTKPFVIATLGNRIRDLITR